MLPHGWRGAGGADRQRGAACPGEQQGAGEQESPYRCSEQPRRKEGEARALGNVGRKAWVGTHIEDSINSLLAYALYVMRSLNSLDKGVADCASHHGLCDLAELGEGWWLEWSFSQGSPWAPASRSPGGLI